MARQRSRAPQGEASAGAGRLALVDCLRFVAALGVLGYHWWYADIQSGAITTVPLGPLSHLASYGYLGVQLFFLISGFVILNSALRHTAAQFAVGRVKRLYPAFWFGVLFTAALSVPIGRDSFPEVIPRVAANLTMLPQLFGQSYLSGVYWTLAYELSFYAVVGIVIFLGFSRSLVRIVPFWTIGMLAITVLTPPLASLPFLGGYYALFASGAILASVKISGWSPLRALGLAAGLAVELVPLLRSSRIDVVPIVVIVVFYAVMYLQTLDPVARLRLPGSVRLGALTYPLYLVHGEIGLFLFQTFGSPHNAWLLGAIALVVSLLLADAVNRLIERRLSTFWTRVFGTVVGRPIAALERLVFSRRASRVDGSVPAPGPAPVPDRRRIEELSRRADRA